MNPLSDSGDHRGWRCDDRRPNLATVIDDDEPVFDYDTGTGFESLAARAIGVDLVGVNPWLIRERPGHGTMRVLDLGGVSVAVVVPENDCHHTLDPSGPEGRGR